MKYYYKQITSLKYLEYRMVSMITSDVLFFLHNNCILEQTFLVPLLQSQFLLYNMYKYTLISEIIPMSLIII